jgi:hypothetical protein
MVGDYHKSSQSFFKDASLAEEHNVGRTCVYKEELMYCKRQEDGLSHFFFISAKNRYWQAMKKILRRR